MEINLGLFHRAIMSAGSALTPWAMASDALDYSRKLANKVGCPDDPDKHAIMVDCLRTKQASELVSADVATPRFLSSLGPTIDGIVIPADPSSLMESFAASSSSSSNFFGSYDLLLGIPRVGYYDFTMLDERHGIESFRRDKILRTLVRNLFTYHLQVSIVVIASLMMVCISLHFAAEAASFLYTLYFLKVLARMSAADVFIVAAPLSYPHPSSSHFV